MISSNKIDIRLVRVLYLNKQYTVKQIASKLDVSVWTLYGLMNKHNILRRTPSETNYLINKDKPQFVVKEKFSLEDQKLKIAGIMLYWAEGTLIGNTVDFANSNPEMIKVFLKFLRDICGIKEERLRVYLYAYAYQDLEKTRLFWQNITKVPLNQFTKPYVREGNPNISQRKLLHGLVHIRYNDKKLLLLIEKWINEYVY
jgi:hypothetical protein